MKKDQLFFLVQAACTPVLYQLSRTRRSEPRAYVVWTYTSLLYVCERAGCAHEERWTRACQLCAACVAF